MLLTQNVALRHLPLIVLLVALLQSPGQPVFGQLLQRADLVVVGIIPGLLSTNAWGQNRSCTTEIRSSGHRAGGASKAASDKSHS